MGRTPSFSGGQCRKSPRLLPQWLGLVTEAVMYGDEEAVGGGEVQNSDEGGEGFGNFVGFRVVL
uniref:Uncharacterized protein n=1 Tax=Oryza glumipatula TaxID=40148 RepID=A0A0E0AA23_9ORYZ